MRNKFAAIVVIAVLLAIGGVLLAGRLTKPGPISTELASAIAKAQSSLPSFRDRLEHAKPPDHAFFLRAVVRDKSGHTDVLWLVHVQAIEHAFVGTVDEEPGKVVGIKRGDAVTIPDADVVDWTISRDDKSRDGGFTVGLEPGR